MKKRLTFQCGKCRQNFSFQKEISAEQEWIFSCPYCGAELLLSLEPFRTRKIDVAKSASGGENQPEAWEYVFPAVIPVSPR